MEIRFWIVERGIPERKEAPHIPFAQHRLVGIDIDGEVEEVGHHGHRLAVARQAAGLQHVDALDDQDVRTVDLDPFVRHDIVDQMRINRRAHRPAPGLDVGEERQQHRQIVALGKALFLHQALPLKHGIGKQKTVCRHQVDLGPRRPARQQCLQHARGGRFADRDRAGGILRTCSRRGLRMSAETRTTVRPSMPRISRALHATIRKCPRLTIAHDWVHAAARRMSPP